jgi:twitching motility protein PilT
MSRLARLVEQLKQAQGTALHISAGAPVRMRVEGRLVRMEVAVLTAEEIEAEMRSLANDALWDRMVDGHPADFPCELGGHRYRARCFMRHGGPTLILRTSANLSSFDELGLPATVKRLAHLRRGLVIIAGPTGSGKSTTVAALLNEIEEGRAKYVATIESPIELTFARQRTSVCQREVGSDTPSFAAGMQSALRQGADVVFTSDIPDEASMTCVLEAVAAGRLVVATVRAAGVVRALERLADRPGRRRAMLNGLAEHLSAVVSLLRLEHADGIRRCVAAEFLVRSRGLVTALREDKLGEVAGIMEQSETMQTMDDALVSMLNRNLIAFETAFGHARDKERIRELRPEARAAARRARRTY